MIASFSTFGGDLPFIALTVLRSLEGSVLWSSVSTNCLHELSPCFFSDVRWLVNSGDLVVHLLQGGRDVISESEVVSCSHSVQYFRWNRLCINTVSSSWNML